MLNKMLFVVVLFTVALFIGSVTSTIYGAWHPCTKCKGERDYCTIGNPCTFVFLGLTYHGTFDETKSGTFCNGLAILPCTDKYVKCKCKTAAGSIGNGNADYPGCE
jgi:hypothetical protein